MELLGNMVLFSRKARPVADQGRSCTSTGLQARLRPQKSASALKEVWSCRKRFLSDGLRAANSFGLAGSGQDGNGGGFSLPFRDNGEPLRVRSATSVHLNYKKSLLAPYEEFQRYKHHPTSSAISKRQARSLMAPGRIRSGGLQSIPKLSFRGA